MPAGLQQLLLSSRGITTYCLGRNLHTLRFNSSRARHQHLCQRGVLSLCTAGCMLSQQRLCACKLPQQCTGASCKCGSVAPGQNLTYTYLLSRRAACYGVEAVTQACCDSACSGCARHQHGLQDSISSSCSAQEELVAIARTRTRSSERCALCTAAHILCIYPHIKRCFAEQGAAGAHDHPLKLPT